MAEIPDTSDPKADPLVIAKHALIARLKPLGIARVEIAYDGEGDSGQIEDISAYDEKGKDRSKRLQQSVTTDDGKRPSLLSEIVDDFAWTVLQHFHDGYENNDGGFGTITLDVAEEKVIIEHSDRIMETVDSTDEV